MPRWLQKALGGWTPRRSHELCFYLTIDDGPNGDTTWTLLEILSKYQIRATFFWVWSRFRAESTPHLLHTLLKEGHGLGLHGLGHLRPWRLSPPQVRRDLVHAQTLWHAAGAPPLLYYRPPYGQHYLGTLPKNMRLVWWDLMPPDFRRGVVWSNELIRRLQPGDVVVLHERKENIPQWKNFFSGVCDQGWKILPLPREEAGFHLVAETLPGEQSYPSE